jgi:hypothetical protein
MSRTSNDFEYALRQVLPAVVAAPGCYRAQAVCRVVGEPMSAWSYRVDAGDRDLEYVYPASRVKLVLAIAAMEKMNRLAESLGITIDETTPLSYHPLFAGERTEEMDTGEGEFAPGRPLTLERLIWRALVASENEPSNKLYEFVGWNGLREWAERHGLPRIVIEHRLSEFRDREEQRWTPRIEIHGAGKTIEIAEARPGLHTTSDQYLSGPREAIGTGYIDAKGGLIQEPMNFAFKNRFDLSSAVKVLERLHEGRFSLSPEQMNLIGRAMSTPPGASESPRYRGPAWSMERFKPMLSGLSAVRPAHEWEVRNKIGEAYGFASDMATIKHLPTGRVAHASASIWCCASGILNADRYEYATVGRPFLELVGGWVGHALARS